MARRPDPADPVSEHASPDLATWDRLADRLDVGRLLPRLLDLVEEVATAVQDRRVTLYEAISIGKALIRLVVDVRK